MKGPCYHRASFLRDASAIWMKQQAVMRDRDEHSACDAVSGAHLSSPLISSCGLVTGSLFVASLESRRCTLTACCYDENIQMILMYTPCVHAKRQRT